MAVILAACTAAGCLEVRVLEPPPDLGAASVLVILRDQNETAVFAADVVTSLADALPPFAGPADTRDLFIVELGCPLEDLGLAAGVQELALGREAYVPPSLGTFQRAAGDRWITHEALPEEVAEVLAQLVPRVEVDCPTILEVPVPAAIEHGVGLGDGSVLAGAGDGDYFRARVGGALERLETLAGGCVAIHRTGEELWVLASFGQLSRGDLERGLTLFSGVSFPEQTSQAWLDGSNEDPPLELIRLDPRGSLARLEGTEWTELALLPPTGDVHRWGGLAWIGPGEHAAAAGDRLTYHRSGQPVRQVRSPEPGVELTTVAWVPKLGVVAGTDHGALYVLEDSGLRALDPGLDGGGPVLGIAPLGQGLIAVEAGRTRYFAGSARSCPSISSAGGLSAVKRTPDTRVAAVIREAAIAFFVAPELEETERRCSSPRSGPSR